MIDQLGWRSLEQRRADIRLVFFYKCFHDLVAVDLSKDLIPKTYDSYHSHLYAYHVPNETKNYIINSFLPRTINQWNNLPESIVLTPSLENFKDGVTGSSHVYYIILYCVEFSLSWVKVNEGLLGGVCG